MSDPHPYLAGLLDATRVHVRRFVVVGDVPLVAISLWNAHTYIYNLALASPYLHPYSPEPGSGKTTLLEVLAQIARDAIEADGLTEAALFRLIDQKRPTLLVEEVDSIFGKKNSDSTEGIRQVLNSGYRRGRQVWRCVPPSHEVRAFDVYCPKATAGLNELPTTLAHRSIAISMKPPRHDDLYEDFDPEETEAETENLRMNLQSWADESCDVLRDPRLKPARLPGLDARGNQIWRPLFRIADQAGGDWPERAREAALELSGSQRRRRDASVGLKLLHDIRDVFTEERMTCAALVEALNSLEGSQWGGWNDGAGITTREVGRKLSAYDEIPPAKTIRVGLERTNGYELDGFEEAFDRYLTPHSDLETVTNRDNPVIEPKNGQKETVTNGSQMALVTVSESGANPHEHSDVTVCHGLEDEIRLGRPLIGDPGYPLAVDIACTAGHITEAELAEQLALDGLVRKTLRAQAEAA